MSYTYHVLKTFYEPFTSVSIQTGCGRRVSLTDPSSLISLVSLICHYSSCVVQSIYADVYSTPTSQTHLKVDPLELAEVDFGEILSSDIRKVPIRQEMIEKLMNLKNQKRNQTHLNH